MTFYKAIPGQGVALAKNLQQLVAKDTPQTVLLANAQGADWDYALIQHSGPTATVTVGPAPANNPNPNPTQARHADTFVSGATWEELSKVMGTSGVYVVGTYEAAPGERAELLAVLQLTDGKPAMNRVVFEHIDGEAWTFLTLDRFGSWDEYAKTMAGRPAQGPRWAEIRQHAESHEETVAQRVQ